ncbi:hypothetical protein [Bradyrhizobium sp. STM 3557]|uniref:hypothetical protein n=1 Tax=Bradyrhizobium sp. STM 3557 TaxID=578920 RepID=UPI00388D5798
MTDGNLRPTEAGEASKIVDNYFEAVEASELVARIEGLEKMGGEMKGSLEAWVSKLEQFRAPRSSYVVRVSHPQTDAELDELKAARVEAPFSCMFFATAEE